MGSYQLPLYAAVLSACGVIGVLVVYSVCSRISSKRRYFAELRRHSYQVADQQEQECSRLAYELHDGILPQLATIRLQLRKSRRTGDAALLEQAEENLLQVIGELRSVLRNLVPRNLQEKGLAVVLKELFQQYQELYPAQIELCYAVKVRPSPGVDLHLYRLVQEAVHNALVHSGASAIRVVVRQVKTQLVVLCQDNGQGLPESPGEGFGLSSLKKRTVILNGEVKIDSRPGKGTRYFFTFPLQ